MKHVLMVFLVGMLGATGWAQPSVRGEIGFATEATLIQDLPEQVSWNISGRLEASYRLDTVNLELVLNPKLRFSDEAEAELGLTELFAFYPTGDVDLSAGIQRLPLEYARLSVPFKIEPQTASGQRLGVPNLRATYYPGDWRLRGVLYYRDEGVRPLVSARRNFTGFELEAFALHTDRFTFGVSGSGLVGDIVLYGESWLLTDPLEARAALGANGFVGDGSWTLEASYAPHPMRQSTYPQLSGQLSYPQDELTSWELFAAVSLVDREIAGQASLSYNRTTPQDSQFAATLGGTLGAGMNSLSVRLSVTDFF